MKGSDLETLKRGSFIARRPAGYMVRVTEVKRREKLRVYDAQRGRAYWISWKTLREKWRVPGGK